MSRKSQRHFGSGFVRKHEKGRNTAKVSILGYRPNVFALRISDIFELDGSTVNPIGSSDDDIPF